MDLGLSHGAQVREMPFEIAAEQPLESIITVLFIRVVVTWAETTYHINVFECISLNFTHRFEVLAAFRRRGWLINRGLSCQVSRVVPEHLRLAQVSGILAGVTLEGSRGAISYLPVLSIVRPQSLLPKLPMYFLS